MIKRYIAIPYTGKDAKVCFVLQVDCNKKNIFGHNDDQISRFMDEYIWPFSRILANAYIQDRGIDRRDFNE